MTAGAALATGLPARPMTVPASRLADFVLYAGVLSGAIVMFEPAPYDLLIVMLGVVSFAMGLALPRAIAPLVILILLFNIGGLINLTVPKFEQEKGPVFVAVSMFLAFTSIFFAAAVAKAPHRIRLIGQALLLSALVAAVLGSAGYLLGIEQLTRYGRAKAAFKDPNVFGPFLILPTLVLAREMLTSPLARSWWKAVPLVILLLGNLLSFSRAAWFLAAFGLVMVWLVLFLNERRPTERMRLILIAAAGAAALVALLAVALSIPEIGNLLEQRAKLTQDYDSGRLGRLARHWIGFGMAAELPLGIGPLDFAHYFGEDTHNVYLKMFLGYTWLGGLAYPALALWTLKALFPLMFRARPWQAYAQCVWVTLFGHLIIGWIIDTDHWRHFFLLWGLAWGMIALETAHRRRSVGVAGQGEPVPHGAAAVA